MKLFTKEIDKKLFAQYPMGADLSKQFVVAKIFNPYGRGTWYILNSDPEDPDYLWAIVKLHEVEVGSVSRSELETLRVPPFRLNLERDLSFQPINAQELLNGLNEGNHYAQGGVVKWQDAQIGDSARVIADNKTGLIMQAYGRKFHLRFVDGSEKTYDANELEFIKDEEFEKGGVMDEGVDLFEDQENIPADVMKILNKYEEAFEDGDYSLLEKANKELGEIGYTFDYYLDGVAYDLRKIGQKGKNEEFAKGGELGVDRHRTYFALFGEVMNAIHEIAEDNGYEIKEIFPDLSYGGVSYGETKKAKAELEWNGKEKRGKSKQREKNTLNIQIYRMDSGSYELNTYFSYAKGGTMDKGGSIATQNKDMLLNYAEELEHHVEEFEEAGKKAKDVEPWVIAKIERSTTDLADVTHYLMSENEKRREYDNGEGEEYAKGGIVVTSIKDIPNFKERLEEGKITYRGLGMGKLSNDFYKIAGTSGTRIKVDGKEYYITDEEFDTFSRGADGKMRIKFDAPARKGYAKGGEIGYEKYDTKSSAMNAYMKGELSVKDLKKVAENNFQSEIAEEKQLDEFIRNSFLQSVMADEYGISKEELVKKVKELKSALFGNNKMAKGGVTFSDKVSAVKSSLLNRKKVSPAVQKDYGKTYSPKEAEESAKRIVGAMTAKERLKKSLKKVK